MPLPFFTVGHSNRSIEDFLGLLVAAGIQVVIDVRRLPGSRRYPQFDADTLAGTLSAAGIGFERIAELAGRRPMSREVPFDVNGFWQNRSFHNYADHALGAEFRAGLDALIARGQETRTTVMCSEAVWWRCHRRIIADHLIARGEQVVHLMGEGRMPAAELTAGAVVRPDRSVVYPASGTAD